MPVDPLAEELRALGKRILRARLESGARQSPPRVITQEEVGEAMGVTGAAVSSWEAGQAWPRLGAIGKLALVLGVRKAWLAFDDGPMRSGEDSGPPPQQRGCEGRRA